METLFIILLCLFAALALVVKLTEKYGEKVSDEKQKKLSSIATVLIMLMLIALLIKHFFEV